MGWIVSTAAVIGGSMIPRAHNPRKLCTNSALGCDNAADGELRRAEGVGSRPAPSPSASPPPTLSGAGAPPKLNSPPVAGARGATPPKEKGAGEAAAGAGAGAPNANAGVEAAPPALPPNEKSGAAEAVEAAERAAPSVKAGAEAGAAGAAPPKVNDGAAEVVACGGWRRGDRNVKRRSCLQYASLSASLLQATGMPHFHRNFNAVDIHQLRSANRGDTR